MKVLTDLIDVKSIVTLAMTGAMIALLFVPTQVNQEAQSLFCTAYGAIITYFFTKRSRSDGEEGEE
jgi:Ni,Fe-hydrogenase I cytochrome b subunit